MKFYVIPPNFVYTNDLYSEIKYDNRTMYYGDYFKSRFLVSLFQLHTVGRLSFLPFKGIWRNFLRLKIPAAEEACLLCIGPSNVRDGMYFKNKILKGNPNTKFVGYFADYESAELFDMEKGKKEFDRMYIYGKDEAKKYGITYYPLPVSEGIKYDLAFIGQSKDRIEEIVTVHDALVPKGVKCFFYIANVEKEYQVDRECIHYGPMMDYEEARRYFQAANCILELRERASTAPTLRLNRAIANNKKILTNNEAVLNNPFFDKRLICYYSCKEEIDADFVKESIYRVEYDYSGEYSARRLLDRIEEDFDNQKEDMTK